MKEGRIGEIVLIGKKAQKGRGGGFDTPVQASWTSTVWSR